MAGFAPSELEFDTVQLNDEPDQGSHGQPAPGADIDAVGGIATRPLRGSYTVDGSPGIRAITARAPAAEGKTGIMVHLTSVIGWAAGL